MATEAAAHGTSYSKLVRHADELRKRCAWREIAELASHLPAPLSRDALELADAVSFAMGRLGRYVPAIALVEQTFALEPSHRRASAAAYLAYASLLEQQSRRDGVRGREQAPTPELLDRQVARDAFRRWIEEALRRAPTSVKDLYRLGVFEAQVESQHDKVALRALLAAIHAFEALPESERARRGDLRKAYHRALYAAGRSALRLRQTRLARRLAFACVRSDRDVDDVAPVFKLTLAGKACMAAEEWEHAERAFRLALDAKGPPRRDYLFSLLARVCLGRGDADAGCRWIETHVRPERRAPAAWRLLGDLRVARMTLPEALHAYENALAKDRSGRHLPLVRIGDVRRVLGDLKGAERAYRDANEFRARKYLKDDLAALAGLADVLKDRGRASDEAEVRARIARSTDGPGLAKARAEHPMTPGIVAEPSPDALDDHDAADAADTTAA